MSLSDGALSHDIRALVAAALAEDVGGGDVTSAATIVDRPCLARIKAKAPGILCGTRVAELVFHSVDPRLDYETTCADGAVMAPGDHVAVIGGSARALLAAERTALNFLQHLSGVATATAEAVRLVSGTGVRILDTRKTTPGLRELEKYAVAVGGGVNHRHGLFDAILIKDNHVAMAGGVGAAIGAARAARPDMAIEVEVRTLAELDEAIEAGAARVLVDNFSPKDAAAAVDRAAGRVEVEVSGGVTLDNIRAYAAARPDFISVGWITHSAPALDLSMKLLA